MWPLCALNGSFVWQGDLFFYAQRESGTVTSSPSCHKRRFNNLPFTLFFCAHTIETPLRGSIQRSNLPCCCERAALQSQLWLSLQVLKWGLQKVNKLKLPPLLPSARCCTLGSFRKVQEVHKDSWRGHQVSSDCAELSCFTSDILMRWNNVAHRRHERKGPLGSG